MRTDVHSEKSLKPEDYEVIEYFYTQIPEDYHMAAAMGGGSELYNEFRAHAERIRGMLKERGAHIHGGWSNCDHCGAYYHHGVLLEHIQTKELITVGWICGENRFELSNIEWDRVRLEKVLKQIRHRRSKISKLRTFVRENREVARMISRHSKKNTFLSSLRYQLDRDGDLSMAQVEAVPKAVKRIEDHEARIAEREAEPKSPAPEGRVVVTGEIVFTKAQDSQYGTTWKMLVKCDGFRVWSTIPAAIETENGCFIDLKGRVVTFTGTLERSKDDNSFAFAKRPSKATLAPAQQEAVA